MKIIPVLFFLFTSVISIAQKDRKAVVMDMTSINQETDSSRYSSTVRLMKSTGLPFEITNSLDTAVLYPVVVLASRIESGKLTTAQQNQLINYVDGGGVLVLSSMRDSVLFDLCGISGYLSDDNRYRINWLTGGHAEIFRQVNDSLELTVTLGDTASGPAFFTRAYYLNGANSLGAYENGESALIENFYGLGKVYAFGPDFRDIYLRNQLDYDINAERTYSNGFEPTSDVFMFIVRNIIRNNIPNSVYKYTSPGKSSASVIITHDIDSDSGIDTMLLFSDMEKQRSIVAQYNITTRYFSDDWLASFYPASFSKIQQLITDGHKLSSHSVGHFPDFADETIFPYGTTGNNSTNYQPFFNFGVTTGGTVIGELEVSKFLLENDHGADIRTFRAGHSAYHDLLAQGLEQMGYEFNSTHSANNVLTGFPYYDFLDRSFSSTESSILEIPMTISDVFNSDPINSGNYMQKVEIWKNVTREYEANNSPVVLLIHPDRMYKFLAFQSYLDSLSSDIAIVNFEDYGDFWRKRDSLDFHTVKTGDSLLVYLDNALLHPEQSFVIDTVGIDTVLFYDVNLNSLAFDFKKFSSKQRLYYPHISLVTVNENVIEDDFKLYPNPASDHLIIRYGEEWKGETATIYDITGKVIHSFILDNDLFTRISLGQFNLADNGLYLLSVNRSNAGISRKFIFQSKN